MTTQLNKESKLSLLKVLYFEVSVCFEYEHEYLDGVTYYNPVHKEEDYTFLCSEEFFLDNEYSSERIAGEIKRRVIDIDADSFALESNNTKVLDELKEVAFIRSRLLYSSGL